MGCGAAATAGDERLEVAVARDETDVVRTADADAVGVAADWRACRCRG